MKKILFLFALLLVGGSAWAAFPSYTICTSGCDYNNLQGAINDMLVNHATPASPVTITMQAPCVTADTTGISVVSGLNLTSSNTLTISATGACAQNGVWNSSAYILEITAASASAIILQSPWITFQNIQVWENDTAASGFNIGIAVKAANVSVFNCLVKMSSGGIGMTGVYATSGGPSSPSGNIYNVIAYSSGGANNANNIGFEHNASNTVNYYNDLAEGNGTGFKRDTFTMNCANCVAVNNTTDYSGVDSLTTSASSDATGSVGLRSISYSTSTFQNVTVGSEDFHLVSGSPLKGVGTTESGTFTTDIAGTTRTVPWDAGPFVAPAVLTNITNATITNANIS